MIWMKKPSLSFVDNSNRPLSSVYIARFAQVSRLGNLINNMQSKSVEEVIAKLSHNSTEGVRLGCTLCGFPGHFRYQCRNFQQINPNQDVILDVSSTSSDSDEDEELLVELAKKESTDKSG